MGVLEALSDRLGKLGLLNVVTSMSTGFGSMEDDNDAGAVFVGTPVSGDISSTDILALYRRLLLSYEDREDTLQVSKKYFLNGGRTVQAYCIKVFLRSSESKELLLEALDPSFDLSPYALSDPRPALVRNNNGSEFANQVAAALQSARAVRGIVIMGDDILSDSGTVESAKFTITGAGVGDREHILSVFSSMLEASSRFDRDVRCERTYHIKRVKSGEPTMVHGYCVSGLVKSTREANILLDTLFAHGVDNDRSAHGQDGPTEYATLYVSRGGVAMVSPANRNAASSGLGDKGMRGVHKTSVPSVSGA